MEYLEFNAGKDSLQDRYLTGLLAGINSVLNIQLADIVDEEPQDEH